MNERIAIVDGIRTPFCKAGGTFKALSAVDLGTICVRELLARSSLDSAEVNEVIFGNVSQPAGAQNSARVIALSAGLAPDVIAHTVHRNCASGMESVSTAAERLLAGRARFIIAGGTESMSNMPLLYGPDMTTLFARLAKSKTLRQRAAALSSFRPAFLKPVIGLVEGLKDPVCGLSMGETAEVLADEFLVTRAEQDKYALRSHQRAERALAAGRFRQEIVSVPVPPRFDTVQHTDNGPREGQTLEQLQRLRPFFRKTTGTVTVGNACQITDGASALLLCTESTASGLGLRPLGYLRDYAYAGLDGARMGLGPVYASAKLFARSGLCLSAFDVIELNEAFAAQVIANERAFASDSFAASHLGLERGLGEIDPERLNVNGGAIALGHPVGSTGNRLLLTVLHELKQRNGKAGLATLCVGGGQGAAFALEAP